VSCEFDTPVLIVGGGPVGFALALDLATRGTRSTLVEQDAGTGLELLAKAGTLNERTMEYCRWLGISDAVASVGFPDDYPRLPALHQGPGRGTGEP
jgi:2-polyprenyl-6-methoxyphenol hydroxylase-like FAD-dependent oxidoreductase